MQRVGHVRTLNVFKGEFDFAIGTRECNVVVELVEHGQLRASWFVEI